MSNPMTLQALAAGALRRTCDPGGLPFASTDELEDFSDVLGQSRAVEAIQFGVGMERDGYNLYAMGPEGIGRHSIVRRYLEQRAPQRATPSDWCYVYNFAAPDQPQALELPAGSAGRFRKDLQRLVEDLRTGIPGAFETDEYRTRLQEIESEFEQQHEKVIEAVGEKARGKGIALVRTPGGFGFAPMQKDKVMGPDEFHALSEAKQKRIQGAIAALEAELAKAIHEVPQMRREAQRKVRELNRQVIGATAAAGPVRPEGRPGGRAAHLLPPARLRPRVRAALQGGGGLRGGHRAHAGERPALCARDRDHRTQREARARSIVPQSRG